MFFGCLESHRTMLCQQLYGAIQKTSFDIPKNFKSVANAISNRPKLDANRSISNDTIYINNIKLH